MLSDKDQTDWKCPACGWFNQLPSVGECSECGFDIVEAGEPDPHKLLSPRTPDMRIGSRIIPIN